MSCQVILKSNTSDFSPGGTVGGKVVCEFEYREKIKGIIVQLTGNEETAWNRLRSYTVNKQTRYRTVHYNGNNNFITQEVNVAIEGAIGPGQFEYPFAFVLPKPCPASFKSEHGRIWYSIKATIDILSAPGFENEVEFNVVAPINFNFLEGLNMNPIKYQDEKVLSCCCWTSGPITMDLNLDREAFVLGETINLKIHILNMSNESVRRLNIELRMHIEEKTTNPSDNSEFSENILAAITDTGVGAHGDRDYNLEIKLPGHIVLPNFALCALFSAWYILKVEAEVPSKCGNSNLKIDAPLNLGHIPLVTNKEEIKPLEGKITTYDDPLESKALLMIDEEQELECNGVFQYPHGEASAPLLKPSSAPSKDVAPLAPLKIPLAEEEDFEITDRTNQQRPYSRESPPPRNNDAFD